MRDAVVVGSWLAALALFCVQVAGGQGRPERDYQAAWCATRGQMEAVLPDKTRVDCLTDTHAIEFDFGRKWAEAIGQALHYARMTGRTPGVVLIIERDEDWRYWTRMNQNIAAFGLGIETWAVGPSLLNEEGTHGP